MSKGRRTMMGLEGAMMGVGDVVESGSVRRSGDCAMLR